jgi:hypothetical protein
MKVIRHGAHEFMAIIEHREEKTHLSKMRNQQKEWVPLYVNGRTTPCAEMHIRTYHVRLCGDQQIGTEIQVFLVSPLQ